MADTERKWTELTEGVLSLCTTTPERDVVRDELRLFEKKGWKRFVLLLAAVFNSLNESNPGAGESGSVFSSRALSLLRGKSAFVSAEDFREGALTVDFNIWWPGNRYTERSMEMLDGILASCVSASGLYAAQDYAVLSPVEGKDHLDKEMVLVRVISTSPVTEDDMALILSRGEKTKEEKKRLGRFLVIRETVDWFRTGAVRRKAAA